MRLENISVTKDGIVTDYDFVIKDDRVINLVIDRYAI